MFIAFSLANLRYLLLTKGIEGPLHELLLLTTIVIPHGVRLDVRAIFVREPATIVGLQNRPVLESWLLKRGLVDPFALHPSVCQTQPELLLLSVIASHIDLFEDGLVLLIRVNLKHLCSQVLAVLPCSVPLHGLVLEPAFQNSEYMQTSDLVDTRYSSSARLTLVTNFFHV